MVHNIQRDLPFIFSIFFLLLFFCYFLLFLSLAFAWLGETHQVFTTMSHQTINFPAFGEKRVINYWVF